MLFSQMRPLRHFSQAAMIEWRIRLCRFVARGLLRAQAVIPSAAGALNYDGGADRDRTGDLINAIDALSQLSYSPT